MHAQRRPVTPSKAGPLQGAALPRSSTGGATSRNASRSPSRPAWRWWPCAPPSAHSSGPGALSICGCSSPGVRPPCPAMAENSRKRRDEECGSALVSLRPSPKLATKKMCKGAWGDSLSLCFFCVMKHPLNDNWA